jgi:predicted DsbA family dithiol-disulfide isomerase
MTTIQDVADPTTALKVTVVSDFICPWCYVGLEVIDRLWNEWDITLDWAPFFLDPTIPPEGRPRKPQSAPDAPKSDLEKRGEAEGIEFRRGRTFTPHTHLALQASEFVHEHGDTRAVIDYHRALFKAYFTDFEDLMDPDVLVRHAAATGLDGEAMRTALAEGVYQEAVDRGIEHSYAIGVQGIPTFILNDQYAVVGAQDYATFEKIMERLGVQRRRDPGRPDSAERAEDPA